MESKIVGYIDLYIYQSTTIVVQVLRTVLLVYFGISPIGLVWLGILDILR